MLLVDEKWWWWCWCLCVIPCLFPLCSEEAWWEGFGCGTQQLGSSFCCNTLQFKLGSQCGIRDLDGWLYRFDSACVCPCLCVFVCFLVCLTLCVSFTLSVSVWAHKCLCWVWAHTSVFVFVCSLVYQISCLCICVYLPTPVYVCVYLCLWVPSV